MANCDSSASRMSDLRDTIQFSNEVIEYSTAMRDFLSKLIELDFKGIDGDELFYHLFYHGFDVPPLYHPLLGKINISLGINRTFMIKFWGEPYFYDETETLDDVLSFLKLKIKQTRSNSNGNVLSGKNRVQVNVNLLDSNGI